MINYVNQEAFFDWYDSVSKAAHTARAALLGELFNGYCRTGEEKFTLPATQTKSGQEESFPFRFENVGCCGASTVFIYFN